MKVITYEELFHDLDEAALADWIHNCCDVEALSDMIATIERASDMNKIINNANWKCEPVDAGNPVNPLSDRVIDVLKLMEIRKTDLQREEMLAEASSNVKKHLVTAHSDKTAIIPQDDEENAIAGMLAHIHLIMRADGLTKFVHTDRLDRYVWEAFREWRMDNE